MRELEGKDLKLIRHILGWSCKDLGEKLGVTKQTISNIETGRVPLSKPYSLAIKYIICTEPNINLTSLIEETKERLDSLITIDAIRKGEICQEEQVTS